MKTTKFLFRILFALYISILLFLSLYSFKETQVDLSFKILGLDADKVIHFIMYLPFPFSAWFAFGGIMKNSFGRYSKLVLFVSGLAVASLTELLQNTTSYRYSDFYDLLANYFAIFLGTILVLIIDRYAYNVWPGRL